MPCSSARCGCQQRDHVPSSASAPGRYVHTLDPQPAADPWAILSAAGAAGNYESAVTFTSYANWLIPGSLMVGRYPFVEPSRCCSRSCAACTSSTSLYSQ
jgi:hypothetical protein